MPRKNISVKIVDPFSNYIYKTFNQAYTQLCVHMAIQ